MILIAPANCFDFGSQILLTIRSLQPVIYATKYSPIDALELGVDIRKLAFDDTIDVRRVPSMTK